MVFSRELLNECTSAQHTVNTIVNILAHLPFVRSLPLIIEG